MDIDVLDAIFGFILSVLSIAFPVAVKFQRDDARGVRVLGAEQTEALGDVADALGTLAKEVKEVKRNEEHKFQSLHNDVNATAKEVARIAGILEGMTKK